MHLFTDKELETVLNSPNVGLGNKEALNVSIDSRNCSPRSLFIGLKGEQVDGGNFLEQAFKQGSTMAIIAPRPSLLETEQAKQMAIRYHSALFIVNNPLYALQALATHHIEKFPKLIKIGITGSSGKTTVKEMVAAILGGVAPVAYTFGNLNSDSGLPLSCFSVEAKHKFAVLEMGMNRKGEMAELADIFKPQYGLITNIGSAHIGLLGSVDAIATEKKAIFSHFNNKSCAFIPQDDAYSGFLAQGTLGKVVFYAPTLIKRFEKVEDFGLDGYQLYLDKTKIRLNFSGKHNLSNACLAIMLAQELGVKTALIKQGLEQLQPLNNRSQIVRGKITLIKDCYNANPQSMEAAIVALKAQKYARKIAFLGAMRELGDSSPSLHSALAGPLIEAGMDAIFLLGEEMVYLSAALKYEGFMGKLEYGSRFESLATSLLNYLKEGDLLLLKGSRFYELERFIKPLEDKGLIFPPIRPA